MVNDLTKKERTMQNILAKIYQIDDLKMLENWLMNEKNIGELRQILLDELLKVADYKNVSDWNKAVRLCECLAIIGWGDFVPLEALRGKFFNGNPMTYFLDKMGNRHFVDAIWSKRKNGLTMELGRTSYFQSSNQNNQQATILWDYPVKEDIQDLPLNSQRNWIAKNPLWFERIVSDCYPNSKAVINSLLNELQPILNIQMQGEKYKKAINRIRLILLFSYHNEYGVKTNYIIADTDKKLSPNQAMEILKTQYSEQEIKDERLYLRNRFEYGAFRKDTGMMTIYIHFEKAFSELSHQAQKEKIAEYALTALNTFAQKQKKLDYNFDLMIADVKVILENWVLKPIESVS